MCEAKTDTVGRLTGRKALTSSTQISAVEVTASVLKKSISNVNCNRLVFPDVRLIKTEAQMLIFVTALRVIRHVTQRQCVRISFLSFRQLRLRRSEGKRFFIVVSERAEALEVRLFS